MNQTNYLIAFIVTVLIVAGGIYTWQKMTSNKNQTNIQTNTSTQSASNIATTPITNNTTPSNSATTQATSNIFDLKTAKVGDSVGEFKITAIEKAITLDRLLPSFGNIVTKAGLEAHLKSIMIGQITNDPRLFLGYTR